MQLKVLAAFLTVCLHLLTSRRRQSSTRCNHSNTLWIMNLLHVPLIYISYLFVEEFSKCIRTFICCKSSMLMINKSKINHFLSCKSFPAFPVLSVQSYFFCRSKIQKKGPSFSLLSTEGWSLRGVRINPVFCNEIL